MSYASFENKMIPWPILQSLSLEDMAEELGGAIDRGVLGKADRVRVDFRVLAASQDFSGSSKPSVYLGTEEDETIDTVAWLTTEKMTKVVHIYPSQARDATNRAKTLEKHILEIKNSSINYCPFILYQLALLNRVAKYKDEIWWNTRHKREWHKAEYSLSIPQDSPIKKEEIKEALKQLSDNLENIKDYITKSNTVKFYEQLLSETNFTAPVFVRGKKITSDILLTLFLPFDESLIKQLSFLMRLPKGRADLNKISEIWDIIPNIDTRNIVISTKNKKDYTKQAEAYADALFSNSPEQLAQDYIFSSQTEHNDITLDSNQSALLDGDLKETTSSPSINIDEEIDTVKKSNLRTLNSYSDLDFSSKLSQYPVDQDNHKIVSALYKYLCSPKDEPDLGEFRPNDDELPFVLSKQDEQQLSDWLDVLINIKKGAYISAVPIKIEYMQVICFFLLMLSQGDLKIDSDANSMAGRILDTTKVPPFLLFEKFLPLDNNINNSNLLINSFDKIKENFLADAFKRSMSETLLPPYKDSVKKYCRHFLNSNSSGYADRVRTALGYQV